MACGDDFGGMDTTYVEDHLEIFHYSLNADTADDALDKLNAFSTTYRCANEELLDTLVAHMKNCKRTEVTLDLLTDFENHILSKQSKSAAAKSSRCSNSQISDRILREIPVADIFEQSTTEVDENELEEWSTHRDCDFHTFDDDKNYTPHNKRSSSNFNNASNTGIDRNVKSKYTGNAFVPSGDVHLNRALPGHRILSACDPKAYPYGHGSISTDVFEIFTSDTMDDEEQQLFDSDNQELPTLLNGMIFPSDGVCLSLDNAMLATSTGSYQLDFDKIDAISIFPGMRMKAKCTHDKGMAQVQTVLEPRALEMAKLDHSSQFPRLKVFIACGPYSTGKDDAHLFGQLIGAALNTQANAVILIGPFVTDSTSAKDSPETAFGDFLLSLSKLANSNMRIYLVPSCQYDLTAMPYFPTPPHTPPGKEKSPEDCAKNITFLPDPAFFSLEGVTFAVSSSEVLFHLSRREIYKSSNVENEDRMQRLVSHLFSSRSIYPMYPSDPNLSFSLTNSSEKLRFNTRNHVLILPSVLQPITKVVDECVVINPGRYIRRSGAGTYAFLEVDLDAALSSMDSGNSSASISPFSEVSLLALST